MAQNFYMASADSIGPSRNPLHSKLSPDYRANRRRRRRQRCPSANTYPKNSNQTSWIADREGRAAWEDLLVDFRQSCICIDRIQNPVVKVDSSNFVGYYYSTFLEFTPPLITLVLGTCCPWGLLAILLISVISSSKYKRESRFCWRMR
jgi:hypothetical protein